MRAIVFDQPGAEDVLVIGDVPARAHGPNDVRIRVHATAVNRADLLQRQGLYPPPPGVSPILGLECAGEVIGVGENVVGFRFGDRVMALLPGGGYAEEVVAHAGSVLRMPDFFSWEEGAAFPETFLTVFLNVFVLARASSVAEVLVHGGGSGIGTTAITLGKAVGQRVLVTAGSAAKCARCLEHGAAVAIDYRSQNFADEVLEATGGRGVDVVLDSIGGKYLDDNLRALAVDGRLVVIGLMGGAKAELNLARLVMRRLQILGSTLRARSRDEKGFLVRSFREEFGEALDGGKLRPVIDRTFALENAAEAHRHVQASEHFGKVVLRVAG